MAADSTVITSHATVEVTSTSAIVADVNADRNYLLIQNIGSEAVFCKAGGAQTGTEGIKIVAGGNWEPFVVPRQVIYGNVATDPSNVSVIQGVKP